METFRHVRGSLSGDELSRLACLIEAHEDLITLSQEGERVLLAYSFDLPDKKPNPLRDWIARRLNY